MPADVGGWIVLVAGLFGLITVAATAFAVASTQWFKTKNEVKDRTINDFKERNTQLETDKVRLEAEKRAEQEKRIALEGIVVGHAELVNLTDMLKKHDETVHNRLDKMYNLFREGAS